jgi:O-antigen ligase
VKWVGLTILLAAVFPLSEWLRRNPLQAPKVWVFVGVMPFLMTFAHLVMAVTLLEGNPIGFYVHGAEFSVLDALAVAILLSLPKRRHSLPFRLAMGLYFFAVLFSTLQSIYPLASLVYAWQLVRMFLVFAVVAKACEDPRVPSAILTGMALGLLTQAVVVIVERFGLGIQQASGTFDHQNLLGLISHFVVFPFFALLLAGQGGWLPVAVVPAGAAIELLTASRATIGLAALGYATVFVLSALSRWTSRKAVALIFGAAVLAILVPAAIAFISVRGQGELAGSDEARAAMQNAALLLFFSHPLGVGANNYVLAANAYGVNAAAGLAWTEFAAFVHNAYLLVAAETGFLGLASLVFLLSRPMFVAFRCGWRKRRDPRGDLLLGFGVAVLVAYLHAAFEWVFVLDLTQYMLALEFGMISGLAQQLGYWRRRPFAVGIPAKFSNTSTESRNVPRPVR